MIEEALRALLLANAPVAALIGTAISPTLDPPETGSKIGYKRISGAGDHTVDKYIGPTECRFQFISWATTQTAARTLAAAVRSVLNGYAGTSESVVIQYIQMEDEADVDEADPSNEEATVYGRRQDFIVTFEE